MRFQASKLCAFIAVSCFATSLRAHGDDAADPFRLVPHDSHLVLRVDDPRRLLDTALNHDLFRQLQDLQSVKEAYESTNYRRFLQLVKHFEKELGQPWPELLDQLAGGGAVVAVKFGKQPPEVATVIQAKSEGVLKRFADLSLQLAEGELARQESKDRLEKKSHRGIDTIHAGKEFHAALIGSVALFANSAAHLHEVIDNHLDKKKNLLASKQVEAARKSLPEKPLAWGYLNLEIVKLAPEAKEIFTHPRNDANLTVAFGGWLDVARRAPYVSGAVYLDGDKLAGTVRMPAGRDGSPAELATHIPPSDAEGSLPLLEPKGVLFSTSSYFDIGKFWEGRDKLFNEETAKAFAELDGKSAPFLGGNKMSELLSKAGPHQRFVVTYQPESNYPKGPFGFVGKLGYGVVADMRDPDLGKSLETILRGAGLLARTFGQVKLKLFEEKHGEVNIIGYRQDDKESLAQVNVQNNPLAYVPSPSFAVVGNQFVAASTVEMTKGLIDVLREHKSAKPTAHASQTRIYGGGVAELFDGIQDILLAQTILDQALSPTDAKEEVRRVVDLVRTLGTLDIESRYGASEFRYDVTLTPAKRSESKTKND